MLFELGCVKELLYLPGNSPVAAKLRLYAKICCNLLGQYMCGYIFGG